MLSPSRPAASVLLVEDDPLSLKLMRDVLEAYGYRVQQATTGPDGVTLASRQRPDLIVMDIGLPGMDGVAATRSLKDDHLTSEIPILAVSAYAMSQDEARMREAGCDSFMAKPLRFADFVAEVGRLLGES